MILVWALWHIKSPIFIVSNSSHSLRDCIYEVHICNYLKWPRSNTKTEANLFIFCLIPTKWNHLMYCLWDPLSESFYTLCKVQICDFSNKKANSGMPSCKSTEYIQQYEPESCEGGNGHGNGIGANIHGDGNPIELWDTSLHEQHPMYLCTKLQVSVIWRHHG